MLAELLRHWWIRCPPWQKRLGVLHQLIALEQRAKRQRRTWHPHWQNCHQAVQQMASRALALPQQPPGGPVAVLLGSGLLQEVPLAGLCRQFARIYCLDLFHLPSTRRHAARVRRQAEQDGKTPAGEIIFQSVDLSGLLQELPARFAPGLAPGPVQGELPPPLQTLPDICRQASLVLSSNCLSQLPAIPLAVAEAGSGCRPDQLAAWERLFIRHHLLALRTLAREQGGKGVTGILCDTRRLILPAGQGGPPARSSTPAPRPSGTGDASDWFDLLRGEALPPLDGQLYWDWLLAPAGEERRRQDIVHQMTAGIFLPET